MYAVVTDEGTAMQETARCGDCYADPTERASAESDARDADDSPDRIVWEDVTGNDDALYVCHGCAECTCGCGWMRFADSRPPRPEAHVFDNADT